MNTGTTRYIFAALLCVVLLTPAHAADEYRGRKIMCPKGMVLLASETNGGVPYGCCKRGDSFHSIYNNGMCCPGQTGMHCWGTGNSSCTCKNGEKWYYPSNVSQMTFEFVSIICIVLHFQALSMD